MVVQPLDIETIDTRYLFWALQHLTDISTTISGSAQPQITKTTLSTLVIPLPPLTDQVKFAETMDLLEKQGEGLQAETQRAGLLRTILLTSLLDGNFTIPSTYDLTIEAA